VRAASSRAPCRALQPPHAPATRPSPPKPQEDGRERYVFFSFPHTAINDAGDLGVISRPNRPGKSCACGALAKVRLGDGGGSSGGACSGLPD
jgi:hypothetical protein